MRLKKPILILIIFLLAIALASGVLFFFRRPAPLTKPIEATAVVENRAYHIGDQILLTIEVRAEKGNIPKSYSFETPENLKIVKKEEGELKTSGKISRVITKYYLTTYEPGQYEIKELTIGYTSPDGTDQELKVAVPAISVESLLTTEAKDIRDLKPLMKAPVNPLIYYTIAGILLLAAIGYLVYRLLKQKKKILASLPEPPLPPHLIAYRRLRELELSDLIETGKIEAYFTILSQIVREYIENRFGAKAQEMTTQEFLSRALQKLHLKSEQQKLLSEFMCLSDLVKYARHVPPYEQIHQAFHVARQFVDETKEEPVTEGGEANVEPAL